MSKRSKRTPAQKAAHIERSIRKWGDYDGTRQAALDRLNGYTKDQLKQSLRDRASRG